MDENYKPTDATDTSPQISALIGLAYGLVETLPMETIGERVKSLRELRELDQTELAKKIGVKQSAISMIESGKTKTLSGKVLGGLCEHLFSTPAYILRGAGHRVTKERARQIAELTKLAQDLADQALTALLESARAVTRATAKPPETAQPTSRVDKTVQQIYDKTREGRVATKKRVK